jgi:uncharacterized membrane protein YesL
VALFRYREDSWLLGFITRLVDVLILNVLWLAFCLPVITIGAATVAAYDVCLKMVEDRESRVARSFLRAFRANLAQGTILWLLNAAAAYALYLDWQIVITADSPSLLLLIVSIVSSVFVFGAFLYAYPQLARYKTTTGRAMINSIKIGYRYFLRTFLLVAIIALEVAIFWWNLATILVGVAIGPMILVYTISGVTRRVFHDIERETGSAPRGETGG